MENTTISAAPLNGHAADIRDIRIDEVCTTGTQVRMRLDEATVEAYHLEMEAYVEFPPIVVYFDGKRYWLADGHHRKAALERTGRGILSADIRQGGQREALLYALQANTKHGLPRSREDKRNAVAILLADSEWSKRSDNWLAETAAVSHTFVGQMRKELRTTCNVASSVRVGRDGKARKSPAKVEPKPVAGALRIDTDKVAGPLHIPMDKLGSLRNGRTAKTSGPLRLARPLDQAGDDDDWLEWNDKPIDLFAEGWNQAACAIELRPHIARWANLCVSNQANAELAQVLRDLAGQVESGIWRGAEAAK